MAINAVDRRTFAAAPPASSSPDVQCSAIRALPDDWRGRPSPYLGKACMIWTVQVLDPTDRRTQRVDGIRIWHAVRPWSVTQRSGAASAACRGSPESRRAGLPLGDEFPCSPGAMSAVLPKLVALLRLEARETSDSSRERRKKIKFHVPRRRSLKLMQGSLEVAIDGVARGYLHVEASGLPKPVILARGRPAGRRTRCPELIGRASLEE